MAKLISPFAVLFCGVLQLIWLRPNDLFAQAGRSMEHFPVTVAPAGQPVQLSVRLRDLGRPPVYVRVYFKATNEQGFRHLDLAGNFDTYSGQIPARFVQTPAIQYFLVAFYQDNQVVSLPATNPYGRPFEIIVQEGAAAGPARPPRTPQPARPDSAYTAAYGIADTSGLAAGMRTGVAPAIQILSPNPLEQVRAAEVVIAVGFVDGAQGIDPASVRILLDNVDVTAEAEISPFVASITPPAVAGGVHRVIVSASTRSGASISPAAWSFMVGEVGEMAEELESRSYSGRAFSELRQEKFSGQSIDVKSVGANIDGTAGPFQYGGLALFTTLENSRFQPRNRFSLLVESKMLDFGLGDLYPYYNDLILWGSRVRGISGALKLGFINFQIVKGETQRLIKPIYGTPTSIVEFGSYKQTLLGGRVSFGGGRSFQLGLSAVKVKDDPNSLKTSESRGRPRDNLVPGLDLLIAIDHRRIEIRASAAYSLLTTDISGGPSTKAEIDSLFHLDLPFDPATYQNILVLNESTVPLDPRGLTSLAYQTSVSLNYFGNFVQFSLKRLGSEFNSLGQTYLRNNIRGFSLSDRLGLFKNKLYTTLGYDSFTDNFAQNDENPAIALKTINVGLAYYPGPDLPTINFSIRSYLRNNGINRLIVQPSSTSTPPDTTDRREQNLTRDINFSVSYDFNALNFKHNAAFSLINSKLIDEYRATRPTNIAAQDFSTTVQMISLRTNFDQQPLTTVISYASNRNDAARGLSSINFNLLSGQGEYRLLRDRLMLQGGLQFVSSDGLQKDSNDSTLAKIDYKQTSIRFGGIYRPNSHHSLSFDLELINYKDRGLTFSGLTNALVPNPSFKNHVYRLYYEYRL